MVNVADTDKFSHLPTEVENEHTGFFIVENLTGNNILWLIFKTIQVKLHFSYMIEL